MITMNEIENEKSIISTIIGKSKRMTKDIKIKLSLFDYKECCIGCQAVSRINSTQVKVLKLNNSYIKGTYIVIGLAPFWNKNYALVKQINTTEEELNEYYRNQLRIQKTTCKN